MYNEYLVTLHKIIIIIILDSNHTNNRLTKVITIKSIRLSNYNNNNNNSRITKYYTYVYLYLLIIIIILIYNVVEYLYEIVSLYINYYI